MPNFSPTRGSGTLFFLVAISARISGDGVVTNEEPMRVSIASLMQSADISGSPAWSA